MAVADQIAGRDRGLSVLRAVASRPGSTARHHPDRHPGRARDANAARGHPLLLAQRTGPDGQAGRPSAQRTLRRLEPGAVRLHERRPRLGLSLDLTRPPSPHRHEWSQQAGSPPIWEHADQLDRRGRPTSLASVTQPFIGGSGSQSDHRRGPRTVANCLFGDTPADYERRHDYVGSARALAPNVRIRRGARTRRQLRNVTGEMRPA